MPVNATTRRLLQEAQDMPIEDRRRIAAAALEEARREIASRGSWEDFNAFALSDSAQPYSNQAR